MVGAPGTEADRVAAVEDQELAVEEAHRGAREVAGAGGLLGGAQPRVGIDAQARVLERQRLEGARRLARGDRRALEARAPRGADHVGEDREQHRERERVQDPHQPAPLLGLGARVVELVGEPCEVRSVARAVVPVVAAVAQAARHLAAGLLGSAGLGGQRACRRRARHPRGEEDTRPERAPRAHGAASAGAPPAALVSPSFVVASVATGRVSRGAPARGPRRRSRSASIARVSRNRSQPSLTVRRFR